VAAPWRPDLALAPVIAQLAASPLLRHSATFLYLQRRISETEITLGNDSLGPLEFEILASLIERPRDAYGVTMMERIEERTGKRRSLPAIYAALDRLYQKGLIDSGWGEPTNVRGGRRKRYYWIKASGQEAVRREQSTKLSIGGFSPLGTEA
jgi:PadR family transcriptional regulator PadR